MKFRKLPFVSVIAALSLSVMLSGCASGGSKTTNANASSQSKQTASDFYKGKTLSIIVPYGPGGGYDQWARIISPYMQKYLGVAKVEVVNHDGGGGIVGTNQIYAAKPDGLTIGDTNAGGDVFDQIMSADGIRFDVTKYNWIGRPDDDPHIIAARPNGPYKTFEDLIKSKSTIKALATGKGSSDYNSSVITFNSFGVPFNMVAAFSGSKDEKAAFLRGNGDTVSLSSSDIKEIQDKANVVILNSAVKSDKLKDVPTVIDLAKKLNLGNDKIEALQVMSDVMDLGHAFFAPPGVPQDRINALRTAFEKSTKDPDFVKEATKSGLYVGFLSGDELQKLTDKSLSGKDKLKSLLQSH